MELTPFVTEVGGRLELAAPTTWLPPARQSPQDAVRRGVLDAERAEDLGYTEVAVTDGLSGPELAARAGACTLADAGIPGSEVALVLHAHSHYQGHDFFSPAHFVAREVGADTAMAVGIEQMCNGAAAALHLAAASFGPAAAIGPEREAALLTTGDSFRGPGFDRWGSDYGMVYGDGGTSVALRPATGVWPELLSVASVSVPALERTHREGRRFAPAARWSTGTVDVRSTKRSFLRGWEGAPIPTVETGAVGAVLRAATEAAAVPPREVRAAVLPRLGADALAGVYGPAVGDVAPAAEQLDPGRGTGHLGAGDLLAGLATLREQKTLEPGETAALLSVGAGFTWSAAVVRGV